MRWRTGGALRRGLPVPIAEGGELERILVALNQAGSAAHAPESIDVSVEEWLARLNPTPEVWDFVYDGAGS